MCIGKSLSIRATLKSNLVSRNPFISGQERRAVCSVPVDCYGNVPVAEGCSDRCENIFRSVLTLMDTYWHLACWELEAPNNEKNE